MKRIFIAFICIFISLFLSAQDDLLKMLDTVASDGGDNKVTAMFKTTKVISMQTPQTVGHGELDFRITHRFGSMGVGSNGGVHTLYGFDAAEDIRFSFDYGITEKFQIGVGRSKKMENLDGSLKYRLMEQTLDNKVPLSICVYSIASLTPVRESQLYSGADSTWIADNNKFEHRMAYTTQILFARKFSNWLSIEVAPGYTHRNYVLESVNTENAAVDENDILSVGAGLRLKVSRSVSILADYFYVLSDYRKNNPLQPYYSPLAVGVEIETGGHVFHLTLANSPGIIENHFIPNSPDSWADGGYKFGFNISRVFTISNK